MELNKESIANELKQHIQQAYTNNNNQLQIIDVVKEVKFCIAVNYLLARKKLDNLGLDVVPISFDNTFKAYAEVVQSLFQDFTSLQIDYIKMETLSLLEKNDVEELINKHYDNLYGDDGIKVI